MDAHAHLISLGWQGDGHALDARPYKQKGRSGLAYDPKEVRSTGGANGLVKPLLVSQRQHKFGIGKKAHEPAAGTEWWLSGFEKALGNIGKSESERETTTSGTATPESTSGGGYKGKHSGLYGFFVKGQPIGGTIGEQRGHQQQEQVRKSKKRKSGQMVDGAVDATDSNDESSSDVLPKETLKEDPAREFEQVGAFIAARDKDEKRKKKVEKAGALEQFQLVGQFFEATERKRQSKIREHVETEEEESATARVETKEERRERRRRRKEEKAALASRDVDPSIPKATVSSSDEAAAKAACRAERRRRKELAAG